MLLIKPARSIQGKLDLPPSPDLFLLAAVVAIAAKKTLKMKIVTMTPVISEWIAILKDHAIVDISDDVVTINPCMEDPAAFILLPYPVLPYRDVIIFTLLSIGKVVAFKSIGPKRIDAIVKKAKKFGFVLEVSRYGENPGLSVKEIPDAISDALEIYDDDVAPLAGLLLGQKRNASYMVDFHFAHPLRNIAPVFGFDISLRSTVVKETDPLARRIKMMQAKKKTSQNAGQQFQLVITCDTVKNNNTEPVEITLPGDEVLGAVMVTAKSLIQKGSFVINNMPLETWGSPVITFLKKMGCKVSAQETLRTAFGSVGMFSIQKCDLFGRKVECRPPQSYQSYLPSMVVLASFAESQSVFRELEDLRNDDPDGIDLIESCIRTIGARHGEMPDGIVMEGRKSFDGFDITENYPAQLSGSLAIAGLKCMGDTNIADDLLLQRWPAFGEMLAGICEFRADK